MIGNKNPKKSWVENEKPLQFISIILNCYLALSVILLLVYLVAPLLGGKLIRTALIVYASWAGMAITMKFVLKKIQKKIRITTVQWLMICLYGVLCMFLWFPYPLNFFFSVLIIIGDIMGYRAQLKSQKYSSP